ncbi:MAG: hypothetical protein OEX07_17075 [Gammaproteobacteria bacterium]|nr:hypothetical protein [Gammaproteobacteria bacterium]
MNPTLPNEAQLKITVFKILEIAYKNDGELTASIVRSHQPFTLSVTSNGTATLTGKVGRMSFNVSEETRSIGFDFKFASLHFLGSQNGQLRYSASFSIGFTSVTFRDSFDVEKFILECSGLVCIVARLMRDRKNKIDAAVRGSSR